MSSDMKIRKLRDVFGTKFLGSILPTMAVIDGSFVGRYQSNLKRRNPEAQPVFNYKTMNEFFRELSIEYDCSYYPEIHLVRTVIDTPENRAKMLDVSKLIEPATLHVNFFDKDIGPPSFFSHYHASMNSMNNFRYNIGFLILVTDDPAYFVVRPHLGDHCIVGPESWRSKINGVKYLSMDEFRTLTRADQPYISSDNWEPMVDEAESQ